MRVREEGWLRFLPFFATIFHTSPKMLIEKKFRQVLPGKAFEINE